MSNERTAFLATIKEHPDGDGPRLVYADWLEECGDPRAEFIRLQCLPEPTAEQRRRVKTLLKRHGRTWVTDDLGIPKKLLRNLQLFRSWKSEDRNFSLNFSRGFCFRPVIVDYSKSLKKMMSVRKFRRITGVTARRFPIQGSGVVRSDVFFPYFYRRLEADQIVEALDRIGLIPAKLEHLLALDLRCPPTHEYVSQLFVCPGSTWVYPEYYGATTFPCVNVYPTGKSDLSLENSYCRGWGSWYHLSCYP